MALKDRVHDAMQPTVNMLISLGEGRSVSKRRFIAKALQKVKDIEEDLLFELSENYVEPEEEGNSEV